MARDCSFSKHEIRKAIKDSQGANRELKQGKPKTLITDMFAPVAINPQGTQIAICNTLDNELVILSTENKRLIFKLKLDETNSIDSLKKPVLTFLNETSLLPISTDLESLELYNMVKETLILKLKMVNNANIKSILSNIELERLLLVLDNGVIVIYDLLDGLKILDTVDIYKSFDDYQLFSSTKSISAAIQMNKGGQVVPTELLSKSEQKTERLPDSFKNRFINYYKNNSNGNICIVFQNDKLVYTSLIKEEFEVIEDYSSGTGNKQSVEDIHRGTVIDTTSFSSSSIRELEPIDRPKLVLRNVIIYNTTTLKFEKILKNLHHSGIQTMCLSEDGNILVTCSSKGTIIRCFNIAEMENNTIAKPFAEFRRGSTFTRIEQLVIDSNNEFIAVLVSNSEIIHIFNLRDYEDKMREMRQENASRFNKYFKKFTKREHIRHCSHIRREYNEKHEFKSCILQFERINKKFKTGEDESSSAIPNLIILYEDKLTSYSVNLEDRECTLSGTSPQIGSFAV